MIEMPSSSALTPGARTDQDLAQALDSLNPVERTTLALVYGRGLTQAEVATELRLSNAVIGAAVARGMLRVAEHLMAELRSAR